MYVFASALCLLSEIDSTDLCEHQEEWTEEVVQCVDYLEQFRTRSQIAQRAVDILKMKLYGGV